MKKRVLVVGDEPDLLDIVAHHLATAGFAVDRATNGTDGLLLASRNRPHVVILDLMRPGRVLSRNHILDGIRGDSVYVTHRTVDTHIKRLRRKLDTELIETVRGVGYRLAG
jgi:DNA-binding response OmpR family regulator